MMQLELSESLAKCYRGELEFEIRDKHHRTISRHREPNIVKIFAKEILAHRLAYSKIWDPLANSGVGGWVTTGIDIDEFAPKYIVFGASFDTNGNPLGKVDSRYYTLDPVTSQYIPVTLDVGAAFEGGLINPVPISEPTRPLKRVERIYFESSYQPAGSPLLQADTRAMNNVLVLETTVQLGEYNGFGTTTSDNFTLTEVALVGAAEIDTSLGKCECNPRDIFLTGDTHGEALLAKASGTATVTLDPSVTNVDLIKEGDQIKLVSPATTAQANAELNQVNPFYLVLNKALGGSDITLDRVPVDAHNTPITGAVGVLRDGFRIFSHRILKAPIAKSGDVELLTRWRIILN